VVQKEVQWKYRTLIGAPQQAFDRCSAAGFKRKAPIILIDGGFCFISKEGEGYWY
jgi:hypothetical protein